jgi:hypothetical protein
MNIHEIDGAAVREVVGALCPKVISSQATLCWHKKLLLRPTSVAHWRRPTDFKPGKVFLLSTICAQRRA